MKHDFTNIGSKDSIFWVKSFFTVLAIVRKVLKAEILLAYGLSMGNQGSKWVGLWGCGTNQFFRMTEKPKS